MKKAIFCPKEESKMALLLKNRLSQRDQHLFFNGPISISNWRHKKDGGLQIY